MFVKKGISVLACIIYTKGYFIQFNFQLSHKAGLRNKKSRKRESEEIMLDNFIIKPIRS